MKALHVPGAESRALSFWSAVFGATLIPLMFFLFRALTGDERHAFWAAAFGACSPLFWSTASRPLSDVTGLAFAVAAQAVLVAFLMGRARPLALTAGAFIAALATGVRVQTAMLTGPVLLLAFVASRGLSIGDRLRALVAYAAGLAIWAVPLIVASGGVDSYITALGGQAGEDFGGVQMLWTSRSNRLLLNAFLDTFVLPWGPIVMGGIVLVVAVAGTLRLLGARALGTLWTAGAAVCAVRRLSPALPRDGDHEVRAASGDPDLLPLRSRDERRSIRCGARAGIHHGVSRHECSGNDRVRAQWQSGGCGHAGRIATNTTTSAHAGMRRVWEWEGRAAPHDSWSRRTAMSGWH